LLAGCSSANFSTAQSNDAGSKSPVFYNASETDGGSDNSDAGSDAPSDVTPPQVLADCNPIAGTYLFSTRVLFSDCSSDAGADASDLDASDADVLEAGSNDASATSIYDTFVSGYYSSDRFAGCGVLDQIDINHCSGTTTIQCNTGSVRRVFSNRYYIKNISAANFTVYSDVEYQDPLSQTYICHETLILNYYKQ
jgi:hypothetical protein